MCDPPAIIEWTNVRILRPGRAPPIRPTRRTVAFTRASNPSRWVSVATSNNPALATRFESSKVTSIRSIACDTRLTGSAPGCRTMKASDTLIVPAQEAFHADTRLATPTTDRCIEANITTNPGEDFQRATLGNFDE